MKWFSLFLLVIFAHMLLLKPVPEPEPLVHVRNQWYNPVTGAPVHPPACFMLVHVFTRCPPPHAH